MEMSGALDPVKEHYRLGQKYPFPAVPLPEIETGSPARSVVTILSELPATSPTILHGLYKSQSSSLCNFLNCAVTSPLLGPNNFLFFFQKLAIDVLLSM